MDRLKSALLVLFCLSGAAESSAQTLLTVYGLENGSRLQSQGQNYTYQLSLGAFRNHDNAINAKNHFQRKTQAPIHIQSSGGVYLVILGPFDDAAALRATSNQLLSRRVVNEPRPIQPVVEKQVQHNKDKDGFVQEKTYTPVVTLGAAALWTIGGDPQTIDSVDGNVRTYVPNNNFSSGASGEVFVGVQTNLANQFQGQAGIALAATSQMKISGEIWDDGVPEFNNFAYNYRVQHQHVMLKGKLLKTGEYFVTPWIGGGIGIGFNQASRYANTPLIEQAFPPPHFLSNHQTAFSYSLSAGIQRAISNNLQIGLGYEFTGWGRVLLGSEDGQSNGHGINISNLVTSGLLLNLTYNPE